MLQPGQRPKVDHYPEHLLVVAYALTVDPAPTSCAATRSACSSPRNALVTVREDEAFDIAEVIRRWDNAPGLAGSGVAFLLHGVLDYAVDTHFDAVQQLDTEIDALEDQLFDERSHRRRPCSGARSSCARAWSRSAGWCCRCARWSTPSCGATSTWSTTGITPYFQDVYDHVLRVAEWTDSLRDLLANILETRLALRSNRLNVIMKKVTSWAAIIAVPTAVTGFYGQNLPYPGFAQRGDSGCPLWSSWSHPAASTSPSRSRTGSESNEPMSEAPTDVALARRCAEMLYARDRASQHLGMTIEAVGPGRATVTMHVTETMINGHDICHGGYVRAGRPTRAFAFACNTYDRVTVAAGLDVTFLRSGPARRYPHRDSSRAGRGWARAGYTT